MDGFDYLTNITPNPMDYRWTQLAMLDDVRNCGMFQFAGYTVPEDLITIGPLGSYITNLIMKPGTLIYAFQALDLSDSISNGGISVNHFTFKVYLEPGWPIVEQYVRSSFGRDFTTIGKSLTDPTTVERQALPYTLLDKSVQTLDSRVRVELSNPSTTATLRIQVLLVCAVPVPALADESGKDC